MSEVARRTPENNPTVINTLNSAFNVNGEDKDYWFTVWPYLYNEE